MNPNPAALDEQGDVNAGGVGARDQRISRQRGDLEGLLLQVLDVGVEAQDVEHLHLPYGIDLGIVHKNQF